MCLIGMNSCGKTSYISRMLEQREAMFTEAPSRVVYCYNVYQPMFGDMERTLGASLITFHQGLPDRDRIEQWAAEERHLMLIFDDLYQEVIESKAICDLTIMLSHHLNITTIMTSHQIFMSAKYSKTIATNLHYILLFTLRNRMQLAVLGSQLFCHKAERKFFVKVYDIVSGEQRYGNPLIIDLSPRSPGRQYMLRSNVLPGMCPIVYEIS